MAKQIKETKRHLFQAAWAILTNSYLLGFAQGTIYQGDLKALCVPGMNCYSCPGAIASCPIGALQTVIGSRKFNVSFYVIGFIMMIGVILGRFVCGWLCPFGLIQDMLHKIPFFKKISTFRGDRLLRYAKYMFLLVFVVLLPLFVVDFLGQGSPYFCKLVCPVGMLEAGIPLVLMNTGLRSTLGWLYAWKGLLLAVTILFSIIIYRPFCKYVCPLGASYALLNRFSFYQYHVNDTTCIHCNKCKNTCKMGVDPTKNANDPECIRCGLCIKVCPTQSIQTKVLLHKNKTTSTIKQNKQDL